MKHLFLHLEIFGEIDLSYVNEILNTPISFGYVLTQFGQWEPQKTNVDTQGLTIRQVINFILIIDVFVLNIAMYNKFFNKGE